MASNIQKKNKTERKVGLDFYLVFSRLFFNPTGAEARRIQEEQPEGEAVGVDGRG